MYVQSKSKHFVQTWRHQHGRILTKSGTEQLRDLGTVFFMCGLLSDYASTSDYILSNELLRMWKEAAASYPGRSQWPRGLRRGSRAARLLRLRVRIPPGEWRSVCCECCVWSGRGLCVGPITRQEESYRVWCVWVWAWSLWPIRGCCAMGGGGWGVGYPGMCVKRP